MCFHKKPFLSSCNFVDAYIITHEKKKVLTAFLPFPVIIFIVRYQY